MSALAPRAKFPTASFPEPGTKHKGVIAQEPRDSQVKNFDTGLPEFWDDNKTQPIMQTQIVLRTSTGEEVAVYAKGRMAKAITGAIIQSGASDLEVGGELEVTFTEYGEPKKRGAKPPKLYSSVYVPPVPGASAPGEEEEPPF
jgi:hypothetical protein